MEEFFDNFESEAVERFEKMINEKRNLYFDTDEFLDVINYYLDFGNIEFAQLAIEKALKIHPNNVDIKVKKIEYLLDTNNDGDAKILIDELENQDVNHLEFLVCTGKYYSLLSQHEKAIFYFEKALIFGEDEVFLNNMIADEYQMWNEYSKAISFYKKALEYDPSDYYAFENALICYCELEEEIEAEEFINQFIDNDPYNAQAWMEYANFLFLFNKEEKGLKALDYCIAVDDNFMAAFHVKAEFFERNKKWSEALAIYSECVDIDTLNAYTYYKMGFCYTKLKKPLLALNYFHRSISEDPHYTEAMIEISKIHEKKGNKKEALHFMQMAHEMQVEDLDVLKRLVYLQIENEEYEESLEVFERITQIDPKDFYNWYAYTEVLMLIDDYENALINLKLACQNFPKRAEFYYQIANALYCTNDFDNAKHALIMALKLDDSLLKHMIEKYPVIKKI